MKERATDKLARVILTVLTICAVLAVCWFLRKVLVYVILAALLAFLGRPIYARMLSLKVKGHRCPDWLAAAVTILLILASIAGLVLVVVPVVSGVISDISKANIENMAQAVAVPLSELNHNLIKNFPSLGRDFKLENVVYAQLVDMLNIGSVSSVVGSVASFFASFGIAIFSMVFIAFFFIRDPHIFTSIVTAFVPDSLETKVKESFAEIGNLISRYFVGLVLEILGVSLINFLGLFFIARMGFRYSIGIAFMTGLFNVLPYIGPLLGGALGLVLSLTIKYVCATSLGISVGLPAFIAIIIGIFWFTQLVDNYVYQPLIYSNSVKAHPLEIFIVILAAGSIFGIIGMLVAIPGYTVARVIAIKFFPDVKAIRMLSHTVDDQKTE